MVMMFVDCVLVVGGTFCTIPTLGIVRGGSFLVPPESYSDKAVKCDIIHCKKDGVIQERSK
jgi:hypothetical protein